MQWSRLAEQEYLPEAKQAASWTQLAAEYGNATEFLNPEDAYDRLAASAEDCTIRPSTVYGNTRWPGSVLSELRPCG